MVKKDPHGWHEEEEHSFHGDYRSKGKLKKQSSIFDNNFDTKAPMSVIFLSITIVGLILTGAYATGSPMFHSFNAGVTSVLNCPISTQYPYGLGYHNLSKINTTNCVV